MFKVYKFGETDRLGQRVFNQDLVFIGDLENKEQAKDKDYLAKMIEESFPADEDEFVVVDLSNMERPNVLSCLMRQDGHYYWEDVTLFVNEMVFRAFHPTSLNKKKRYTAAYVDLTKAIKTVTVGNPCFDTRRKIEEKPAGIEVAKLFRFGKCTKVADEVLEQKLEFVAGLEKDSLEDFSIFVTLEESNSMTGEYALIRFEDDHTPVLIKTYFYNAGFCGLTMKNPTPENIRRIQIAFEPLTEEEKYKTCMRIFRGQFPDMQFLELVLDFLNSRVKLCGDGKYRISNFPIGENEPE